MFASNAKRQFRQKGYFLQDEFLTVAECSNLLRKIDEYRRQHSLTRVFRQHGERSLNYFVLDGPSVKKYLDSCWKLYRYVNQFVNQLDTFPLIPLRDQRAAVNINITPPGGEYRWHYDRNRVTALLYLNAVEGGELEFCPKYRISAKGRTGLATHQQWLDQALGNKWMRRIFGGQIRVAAKAGRLIVMRGDLCLHSVRPVTGNDWRINVVMAYDDPHQTRKVTELDGYLYEPENSYSKDPNYMETKDEYR